MQKNVKLEIFDDNLAIYGEALLSILLKDRTTGKNIIWATDDYITLGEIYKAENEIALTTINGDKEKFIRPRITKSYERQNNRTKEKAEVFTPSWVCNRQNNLIDEQWFGRKNVFNISEGERWSANKGKIEFLDVNAKGWHDYVDARRIEITCGEAPFLVSRYDAVTGKSIDLDSRVGLLDRKLRVVNENAADETDWFKWVVRAYESTYGYEYQGDNLLLARENLLITFIDNVRCKFGREPKLNELKRLSTIISWNLWQMDGLTFSVPFSERTEGFRQISIFDTWEDIGSRQVDCHCKVKNWRSNTIVEFRSLMSGTPSSMTRS